MDNALNLSPATLEKIERTVACYPYKRSAALPLCHLVQEDQGYLSDVSVEWIAARLELQPIHIYELVTFYPMLRRSPKGRCHIKVCRTLPCALRGAYETCSALEKAIGCKEGAVSEGGAYSIEFVECQADCALAPVVIVDETLYSGVDVERAQCLAKWIKGQAGDSDMSAGDFSHPSLPSKPA